MAADFDPSPIEREVDMCRPRDTAAPPKAQPLAIPPAAADEAAASSASERGFLAGHSAPSDRTSTLDCTLSSSRNASISSFSDSSHLSEARDPPGALAAGDQERVLAFLNSSLRTGCTPETSPQELHALGRRSGLFLRIESWRRRGIILKDLPAPPPPPPPPPSPAVPAAGVEAPPRQFDADPNAEGPASPLPSAPEVPAPGSVATSATTPCLSTMKHTRPSADFPWNMARSGSLALQSSDSADNLTLPPRRLTAPVVAHPHRRLSMLSPGRVRAFINSCATADEQAGRVPLSQQTKARQKAMFRQIEAWRRAGVDLNDIPDPPKCRS
eukprot:EG_transcript_10105